MKLFISCLRPAAVGALFLAALLRVAAAEPTAPAAATAITDGNLASHGTPMRRLIDSGAVLGKTCVQVGPRGYWPPQDTFEWMQSQGMRWHLMHEIWERTA